MSSAEGQGTEPGNIRPIPASFEYFRRADVFYCMEG